MEEEIIEYLIEIISDKLAVNESKIKTDSNLKTDLKADSYDLPELFAIIEDDFNITIPNNERKTINTVNDLVKCIGKKL